MASIVPVTVEAQGLTGDAILSAVVSGHRERFHWAGPGSTVRLVWCQTLVTLDDLRGWQAVDLADAKAQVRHYVWRCGRKAVEA